MPLVATRRILKLTVIGSYLGQTINNVFNYRSEGGGWQFGVDASQFAQNFWTSVVRGTGDWATLVNDQFTFVRIEVQEYENPDVFGSFAPAETGDVPTSGDQAVNSFTCVGLRYNPASRIVRPGHKRICGLVESQIVGNTITAAYATQWAGAVDDFANSLQVNTLGEVAVPIILGIRYVPNTTPREPLPLEQWAFSDIASFTVKSTVTSQVSRKFGVGV